MFSMEALSLKTVLLFLVGLTGLSVALIHNFLKSRTKSRLKTAASSLGKRDKAGKEAAAPAGGDDPRKAVELPPGFSAGRLRAEFKNNVRLLRANVSGRDYRYGLPWYLMIGQAGSAKSTLLLNSGLRPSLQDGEEDLEAEKSDLKWWFFDQGILLDVPGHFVLSAAGQPVHDKPWETVLSLLVKHRGQRPIDGAVLAVPWPDLAGRGKPDLLRIRNAADLLYQRVSRAQAVLGMNFPVYVVVTKCDHATGFSSFCEAIPESMSQSLFGWSNPYNLTAAFNPSWVDEAIDAVSARLQDIELEIYAEGREMADPDAFFLFPKQLASVREPLRAFLSALFKKTVYQESFFFRGIYFVGDAGDMGLGESLVEPAAGENANGEGQDDDWRTPAERRPFFVTSLLVDKVFAEFGLARPSLRAFLTRRRTVVVSQALIAAIVLLGGALLWRANHSLRESSRALVPALARASDDLQRARAASVTNVALGREAFLDAAGDLISAWERYDGSNLKSTFIPTSWFSRTGGDIRAALGAAYRRLILGSLEERFRLRRLELARGSDSQPTVTAASGETAEFAELRNFVTVVRQYESAADRFNRLASSADPEDLKPVIAFAYDTELPPSFYEAEPLYDAGRQTLPALVKLPLAPDPELADRAVELAKRMFLKSLGENPLFSALHEVSEALDLSRSDDEARALRGARQAIEGVETTLRRSDVKWLENESYVPTEALGRVLDDVTQAALLGPKVRERIEKEANDRFRALRTRLAEYRVRDAAGLVGEEEGLLKLELGPGLTSARDALDQLLALPFMAERTPHLINLEAGPNERLVWNPAGVDRALEMVEAYNGFSVAGLKGIPPGLDREVALAARGRLEANLSDTIGRAVSVEMRWMGLAGPGLEADLRQEARGLAEVGPRITRLINATEKLRVGELDRTLRQVVRYQGDGLLVAVDRLLEREGMYGVSETRLAWWDGRPVVSFRLFDVADEAGLQTYLEVQRNRVRKLAIEYAAPAVSLLTGVSHPDGEESALLGKWGRILEVIDRYEKMSPGTSLAALESYILKDLTEVTLSNCLDKIAEASLPRADFFEQRGLELRRRVRGRCLVLAQEEVVRGYGDLAQLFNRELAGSAPFATPGTGFVRAVEPGALRTYFKASDAYVANYFPVLEKTERLGSDRYPALAFLEQMKAVRAMFAWFLEQAEPDLRPVFDLDVDFRVNQSRERGAENIIDWTLTAGPNSLSSLAPKQLIRWTEGDPVVLGLRWAKDSPTQPMAAPGLRVDADGRATFTYSGPWSLTHLILANKAPSGDLDRGEDLSKPVLRFVVPTRTGVSEVDALVEEVATGEAVVYVRVQLLAPEGKSPLVIPKFPVSAPSLVMPNPATAKSAPVLGASQAVAP